MIIFIFVHTITFIFHANTNNVCDKIHIMLFFLKKHSAVQQMFGLFAAPFFQVICVGNVTYPLELALC